MRRFCAGLGWAVVLGTICVGVWLALPPKCPEDLGKPLPMMPGEYRGLTAQEIAEKANRPGWISPLGSVVDPTDSRADIPSPR